MSRICLVGAGELSCKHAEALEGIPGHQIATIVDADTVAARRLARRSGAGEVFTSVEEALADASFDRAHVLVPPDQRPRATLPLLAAGKPVLLEQPVATDPEACHSMLEAAAKYRTVIGVNDGFVHHPAYVRLQRLVKKQELGRSVMVFCLRNVPLSELERHRGDELLLDYALHPLTQITGLAGPIEKACAFAGPSIELADEKFPSPLDLSLTCADLSARLRISVGRRRALWQVTAICDDGVAVADILENRIDTHGRTRWRDAIQDLGIDWPMRARSSTTRRATFWTRRFRSFIRRGAAIRYASACAAALPLSMQRSMPAVRRNLMEGWPPTSWHFAAGSPNRHAAIPRRRSAAPG